MFAVRNKCKHLNNYANTDPLFKLTIFEFKKLMNGDLTSLIEDVIERKLCDLKTNKEEPTLDVNGAAKLMNVSRQTVYQNIKSIPHRKVFGKLVFFREEIIKFIDTNGNTNYKK